MAEPNNPEPDMVQRCFDRSLPIVRFRGGGRFHDPHHFTRYHYPVTSLIPKNNASVLSIRPTPTELTVRSSEGEPKVFRRMAPGHTPQDAEATSFFTVSATQDDFLEPLDSNEIYISEYRGNESAMELGDSPINGDLPRSMASLGRFPGYTTLEMVTYITPEAFSWEDALVIIKRSTTLRAVDGNGQKCNLEMPPALYHYTLYEWVQNIHPHEKCPTAGGLLWWHELNHLRLRLSERAYLEVQKVLDAINFQEPPPVWYVQPIPAEQVWKQSLTRVRTLPKTRADQTCMICRSRYKKGEHNPVKLACGHIVGQDCIKPWLATDAVNIGCPLCFRPCFPPGLLETASWKPDLGVRRELLFQQELDAPYNDNEFVNIEERAPGSLFARMTELWDATKQSGQGSLSQPERYNPAGWIEMTLLIGQMHKQLIAISPEMSFLPHDLEDMLMCAVHEGFEEVAQQFSMPTSFPPFMEAFSRTFIHRYVKLLCKPEFLITEHKDDQQGIAYEEIEELFSPML